MIVPKEYCPTCDKLVEVWETRRCTETEWRCKRCGRILDWEVNDEVGGRKMDNPFYQLRKEMGDEVYKVFLRQTIAEALAKEFSEVPKGFWDEAKQAETRAEARTTNSPRAKGE